MDAAKGADQFLIEQVREGHEAAWRQLIDRYAGRLLAFARARTASLSDAEDLVQETFVGFLQSLDHYNPARSLETYLFSILRYKLYDQLRQRKTNVLTQPPDVVGGWDQLVPGSTETPSWTAAQAEAQAQQEEVLADILKQLINEYRDRQAFGDLEAIELAFFAGRRNLEIAELLDIDQKAVAGIKFRAIQKLQKYLAQRDPVSLSFLEDASANVTVSRVWREQRLTCLKRSTLGSYLLGVLDEPWNGYTQFHLDVVGCSMCLANLDDLASEEEQEKSQGKAGEAERMFTSSVGFLRETR